MITIPTIKQLYDSILSDLETEYGITVPIFGKSFLRALAGVQAAKLKLFYLSIGNLQKNIFVDTADPESMGGTLERFGRVKLGRSPFPAKSGQYQISVTGTVGAVIKASTTFKSNDDSSSSGKLFILDNQYTLQFTTDTITVRALEAGLGSKLVIGDKLTVTAPIAGVDRTATVTLQVVAPQAEEDIEEYRLKTLAGYREEPYGGAGTDYRLWASDVQGVKQVYPYAKSGFSGEVNIFVEANLVDSTDGKGTPTSNILSDVASVIEFDPDVNKPINERGRRPITVKEVHVLPIVVKDVSITITGYQGLNSSVQTLIENSLREEISKVRPFIGSVDILADKNNILDKNKIIAAILKAKPGSVFGVITLTVGGVAVDSYNFDNGEIPFLNSVSYV